MGGAVVMVMLWLGTSGIRAYLPYLVPWGIYVIAGVLSSALGSFPVQGAITIGQDIAVLAWAAAIANVIRTPDALRTVLRAWVYGSTAWGAALVVAMLTHQWWLAGGGNADTARGSLFFGIPNIAGNFFALALFVLLLGDEPRTRSARIAMSITLVTATIFTGSLAALSALVIGVAVTAFIAVWRRWDLVHAIGSSVLAVALVAVLAAFTVEAGIVHWLDTTSNPLVVYSLGRSSRSAESRQALWPEVWELYRDGNPLGIGAAATLPSLQRQGEVVKSAHDDYLATLVERGPIGVISLLILIGGLLVRTYAVVMKPISKAFEGVIRDPAALAGALVTVWITSFTHEVLHYRQVWAFFGLVAGLYLFARATSGRERSSTSSPVT